MEVVVIGGTSAVVAQGVVAAETSMLADLELGVAQTGREGIKE